MAAQAILGPAFRITEERGRIVPADDDRPAALATWHPSAIVRARSPEERERMLAGLIADLAAAAEAVADR